MVFSKTKTFLSVVLAVSFGALFASESQAAALGYGDFLGEFSGNVNSGSDLNAALGDSTTYQHIAKWENGSSGALNFTMTAFKDGNEPIGGTWEYLQDSVISMLLTVKYSNLFSIFRYPTVGSGDTGLFASDPALTGFPMSTNTNGSPFAISHVDAWSFDSFDTPAVIPLPPTMLLFASGLAGLGIVASRRRRT